MAVKRQLILNLRDQSNEELETTISNINPSATVTNAQLYQAAVALNSLTTNTLVSVYVVNTEDITGAE